MTLCLASDRAVSRGKLADLIGRNFAEEVVAVEERPGGANSEVFVVSTKVGGKYLVKKYRSRPADTSDRLTTEFEGLTFLWQSGIRLIPRPLCQDRDHSLGVYEYIQGRKLQPGEVSVRHLGLAAEFLGELFSIRQALGAAQQPLACEACLSLQGYVDVVQIRLDRLLAVPGEDALAIGVRAYLEEVFTPFFHHAKAIFFDRADGLGLDPCAVLPVGRRVLSPSDFGFHNAIVAGDGRLVFIDFEYYGWDDPAKLIADFYLQPAVPVPPELRRYFLEKLDFLVANDSELTKRLPLAYLLSALKWCLLLLNCFLQVDLARRPSAKELFMKQLDLSRRSLQRLAEEMAGQKFPLDLL